MAKKPDTVITDTGDVVETQDEIQDAEVVEETEERAAIVQAAPGQLSIYQSSDPAAQLAEARERAAILLEVIHEQGLARTFGNATKPHVFVEGWQFLASQFGLIPDVEWSHPLTSNGTDVGWEARAVLRRLADGAEIAHAEAECRTDEPNWRNRPSYAVRSMAQTRAVSKVCRIALSSVMVMAGFNATPAEEMEGVSPASRTRGTGAAPPNPPASVPRSTPRTTDDPHCPACLDNLGVLIGVTGPHDRKPFWRCTAKPEDCGGHRQYQGKDYSWSGWHNSWENSARDYRKQPIIDDPKTVTIKDLDPDERHNQSGYIVHELMEVYGLEKAEAEQWVKPALVFAVEQSEVDVDAALGGPPADPITDDELRVVIANMTGLEAQAVISGAVDLMFPKKGE